MTAIATTKAPNWAEYRIADCEPDNLFQEDHADAYDPQDIPRVDIVGSFKEILKRKLFSKLNSEGRKTPVHFNFLT